MKRSIYLLPLLFFCFKLNAAYVDTVNVYSNSMRKDIKTVVIRPQSYSTARKYNVVYLLHGYGGNHSSWVKDAPQLTAKADEMDAIFICPDGGFSSWYLDSPVDSTSRYETFVATELVQYTDSHYSTAAGREHRAVTGLSMGGHGALYLAIRHRDIFGSAGSVCGGVDTRPFPKNWNMAKVFGDPVTQKENWDRNVVINQVDHLKNGELQLIIDCGTGDFFLAVNRELHQKLLDLKIDHDYTERPGAHNKAYWGNSIDFQLLFFKKYFDRTTAKI